jgi:hypothetical protein
MMQSRIGICGYAECGLRQGTPGKKKPKENKILWKTMKLREKSTRSSYLYANTSSEQVWFPLSICPFQGTIIRGLRWDNSHLRTTALETRTELLGALRR